VADVFVRVLPEGDETCLAPSVAEMAEGEDCRDQDLAIVIVSDEIEERVAAFLAKDPFRRTELSENLGSQRAPFRVGRTALGESGRQDVTGAPRVQHCNGSIVFGQIVLSLGVSERSFDDFRCRSRIRL
jgi:hypothetical protein